MITFLILFVALVLTTQSPTLALVGTFGLWAVRLVHSGLRRRSA